MRHLVESRGSRSALEDLLRGYLAKLPRLRDQADVSSVAATLTAMGRVHVRLGEVDSARECLREVEELMRSDTPVSVRSALRMGKAELHLQGGEMEAARTILEDLLSELDDTADANVRAEAATLLGSVYRKTDAHQAALEQLGQATLLSRASGALLTEAEAESERALVLQTQGRNREALQCLVHARGLFEQLRMSGEAHSLGRRLDWLEQMNLHLVQAWGESIESKDRYTAGHCERVAGYACTIAEAVGFANGELDGLRIGAFLHDVGKTAVPAEILNKPGKLDDDEWALMKSHTVVGDEMIAELHFPWEIRPIVRSHHERWDGTGYPDGLAGEEIPFAARILCVADVFDALTTTRSYRPALSRSEALEIMQGEVGRGLDPSLFGIFVDRLQESHNEG